VRRLGGSSDERSISRHEVLVVLALLAGAFGTGCLAGVT